LGFFQDLFVVVLSWLPVACSRLSDGGMPMKNIECGKIYRGYYMTARRYEFYFRVVKYCFLPRENKIHILIAAV